MRTYGSTVQQLNSSQKGEETMSTANSEIGITSLDVSDNGRATTTSNRRSEFPSLILPLFPEKSPLTWIIINNTLAASGCFLIIDLCYTNWGDGDPAEEQPFATAFFLIWEFATCFFWTTETGLSATYQHFYLHQNLVWYTKLELVIAAYFMLSTFRMLCEWNLLEYDHSVIWEIALDTSFYVYLAVRSCRKVQVDPQQEQATISLEKLEGTDAGTTLEEGYRILENGNNASGVLT